MAQNKPYVRVLYIFRVPMQLNEVCFRIDTKISNIYVCGWWHASVCVCVDHLERNKQSTLKWTEKKSTLLHRCNRTPHNGFYTNVICSRHLILYCCFSASLSLSPR